MTTTCWPDPDGDGFATAAAVPAEHCGGCPTMTTGTEPVSFDRSAKDIRAAQTVAEEVAEIKRGSAAADSERRLSPPEAGGAEIEAPPKQGGDDPRPFRHENPARRRGTGVEETIFAIFPTRTALRCA